MPKPVGIQSAYIMKKIKELLLLGAILCSVQIFGQQTQSLNLREIVSHALDYNKTIASKRLDIEKNELTQKQIRAVFIPTIEASGTYGFTQGSFVVDSNPLDIAYPGLQIPSIIPGLPGISLPPGSINVPGVDDVLDFQSQAYLAGVTAKWTLFTGFKATNLIKASNHKNEAEKQLLNQQEKDFIIEIANYVDQLSVVNKVLDLLEFQQQRLDTESKAASKALEQGLITRSEAQKIVLAQLQLDSKKTEFSGNKAVLSRKLQQLTGIPMQDFLYSTTELVPITKVNTEASYLDRPELKALEEAQTAKDYQIKSENAGYLPKVQAFATTQYAGFSNGNIADLSYNNLSVTPLNAVGIGAKWELFDGMHTKHKKDQLKIEKQQLELKKQDTEELLSLNYDNALSQFNTANTKLIADQKGAEIAKEQFEIAVKEYHAGLIGTRDLLETQSDLITMQTTYYKSLSQQRISALKLMNAGNNLTLENL